MTKVSLLYISSNISIFFLPTLGLAPITAVTHRDKLKSQEECDSALHQASGGVRHDPQRFMGKTITVPHFNRDTVEFASRKRNKSNPGNKTLLPFPKNITEESDFENFQDLIVALDNSQGNVKKFIAIRRRTCDLFDFERRLISCFS